MTELLKQLCNNKIVSLDSTFHLTIDPSYPSLAPSLVQSKLLLTHSLTRPVYHWVYINLPSTVCIPSTLILVISWLISHSNIKCTSPPHSLSSSQFHKQLINFAVIQNISSTYIYPVTLSFLVPTCSLHLLYSLFHSIIQPPSLVINQSTNLSHVRWYPLMQLT